MSEKKKKGATKRVTSESGRVSSYANVPATKRETNRAGLPLKKEVFKLERKGP